MRYLILIGLLLIGGVLHAQDPNKEYKDIPTEGSTIASEQYRTTVTKTIIQTNNNTDSIPEIRTTANDNVVTGDANAGAIADNTTNQGTLRDTVITEMAATALNTTHRGLTNNPHEVNAEQAGAIAKEDIVDGETVVKIHTDTSSMSILVGVNNAGDTIGFTVGNTIGAFPAKGSHGYVIREFGAVVDSITIVPDIDLMLQYDVNFNDATPTDVLSSNLTVTSVTTGNTTTSFTNATIPKDVIVTAVVKQKTGPPTQCLMWILYSLVE